MAEMDDPDQAHRHMEERIVELKKEKEKAGKREEAAKALAEEERVRAEEEKRIHLKAQVEVHELRARLGL